MLSLRRIQVRQMACLLIFSLLLFSHIRVPDVEAAGTLFASPAHNSALPVGSTFKIQIRVGGIDAFNAWDIQVSADQAIVNATDISLTGTMLPPEIFAGVQCINGGGLSCQPQDGQGIVHSAIAGTVLTSGTGLLFTITYKVVGAGYSKITIFNDVMVNGNTAAKVPHSTTSADYGVNTNAPSFAITALNNDLNVTQGKSLNATIGLTSLNGFSGLVSLSISSSIFGGLSTSLLPSTVSLRPNGVNATVLSIVTNNQTQETQFTFTITGRSGTTVSDTLVLHVSVLSPPDFLLGASPSLIRVHAADTGRTTIIVQSQYAGQREFLGRIDLSLQITTPGPMATLDMDHLSLTGNGNASATLTVQTPPANVTFRYTITLTATSGKLSHSIDVYVTPPAADFAVSVSALSLTLKAGDSGQLKVTLSSQDYFEGIVYLFATSPSGTKLSYSPPRTALCIVRLLGCSGRTETAASNLTLTADASMTSGQHYVVLTAISGAVTHSLNITINVLSAPGTSSTSSASAKTILGLQPLTYFGVIAAIGVALTISAVREVRRPKAKGRRIYLEDSPTPQKSSNSAPPAKDPDARG